MTTVALETSVVLAYLNDQTEAPHVAQLINLAEQDRIQLLVSRLAWDEIDPSRCHDIGKYNRLRALAGPLPKVARLGEWILGEDMLGHDDSADIEYAMPAGLSRTDREQLLSVCARADIGFFATKDRGFVTSAARNQILDKYNLRVGSPGECVSWLQQAAGHE